VIIMETHNWAAGSQSTDAMMRWLIVNGLNVDVQHSRQKASQFCAGDDL